jgi:hypothetical protein
MESQKKSMLPNHQQAINSPETMDFWVIKSPEIIMVSLGRNKEAPFETNQSTFYWFISPFSNFC